MNGAAPSMRGPSALPLLSHGFRPFFLAAGLWAATAMALWVAMLSGRAGLPTALDPVAWHAHEFLYGYLGAVIAGFLLTAVPNWTGRPPVVGRALGGLLALWILGRVAIALSRDLPPLAVAAADLALPVVLGAVIGRDIVAARNWRNLPMLAMLLGFALGNAAFHWEAAGGGGAAQGHGLRLGLGAALMMIAFVGGRIVPSFTRNWLVGHRAGRLPVPPMQPFDKAALLALLAALLAWLAAPAATATGVALILAGVLHLVRLARWAGDRTMREPLVWVLHLGYAFLPVGALAVAAPILSPTPFSAAAAQHVWMAGAVGLMTLAVMTRATRGHTGHPLTAGIGTTCLYGALVAAVIARVSADIWTGQAEVLRDFSSLAWILAFGGFAALYSPRLLWPRTGSDRRH